MASADAPTRITPFHSLSLGDLVAPKAEVVVTCRAYHHSGRLAVIPLLGAKGPQHGIRHLERTLRCDGCGQRGWASVSVEWFVSVRREPPGRESIATLSCSFRWRLRCVDGWRGGDHHRA